MLYHIATLLVAVVTSSGLYDAEVCGGHEATVAVMWGNEALCTGVVIREDVVLTAAHCLTTSTDTAKPSDVMVSSANELSYGMHGVTVSRIEIHPQYSAQHSMFVENSSDIAILFLTYPIHLHPAKLPDSVISVNTPVMLEGYGKTEHNTSGVLACRRSIVEQTTLSDIRTKGACYGDSGGPMYVGNTVHGIGSRLVGNSKTNDQCEGSAWYLFLLDKVRWIDVMLASTKTPDGSVGCSSY